jgi:hypothetical protein
MVLGKKNFLYYKAQPPTVGDSPQSEPGTKYNHCNAEFYILGAVIESITHKNLC